mmetsp:Transcript_12535/g.27031  ORF Transcript_12535/g.27031 Transcript_12535/m.27031 type:complete len:366 (+) Transcript_12535:157-1254(+)|eukprot:CAMPEP_0202894114 /NCGR_PEP_ID=MMETSP1392-20130828/3561_1 /ASSEMBLY_ACC=CAM_ASM_000868 /TAXON_ID=225041 /ORGANISM="Chlamydomonas chlamydogama, Strain SAG 11-48b" /LENGTH=365 /DNA_ID=CAMNT_0049578687 /DNA_START=90 /DNA_END=1187 /DNA_ORIENTATION=+
MAEMRYYHRFCSLLVLSLVHIAATQITVPIRWVNYQNSPKWVIPITLGTPAQEIKVVLDSGSAMFYTNTGNPYNPAQSTTATTRGIKTSVHYFSPPEIPGQLYTDVLRIGKVAVNYTFMATTHIANTTDPTSPSGLMGWAWPAWAANGSCVSSTACTACGGSNAGTSPVFQALYGAGYALQNLFSTWLKTKTNVKSEMVIGGINRKRYKGNITWAKIIRNTGERLDFDQGVNVFWMFHTSITIQYTDGFAQQLCTNCTAIADTGTGSIKGPKTQIDTLLSVLGKKTPHGCARYLVFSFPGSGSIKLPLNTLAACTAKLSASLLSSSVPCTITNKDQWWTLGVGFVNYFHTTYDFGNGRIGFAPAI